MTFYTTHQLIFNEQGVIERSYLCNSWTTSFDEAKAMVKEYYEDLDMGYEDVLCRLIISEWEFPEETKIEDLERIMEFLIKERGKYIRSYAYGEKGEI